MLHLHRERVTYFVTINLILIVKVRSQMVCLDTYEVSLHFKQNGR